MLLKTIIGTEKRLHHIAYRHAESLGIYRIVFSLFYIVFGFTSYTWIANFPQIFFKPYPLTIAYFFNGFPGKTFFSIIDFFTGLLLICLLFGFKTRFTTLTLAILTVIGKSFLYSFGKIDHTIMFELTLLLMFFSPWGDYYSLDSLNKKIPANRKIKYRNMYSLSLLALCLSFGFFTAGFSKLGWIDFNLATQGAKSWLDKGFYIYNRTDLLAKYFLTVKNTFLWEILDYLVVFFEISFLVICFTTKRFFNVYLCLAVFFHLLIFLILNIAFIENIVAYAAFVEWNRIEKKKLDIIPNIKRRHLLYLFAFFVITYSFLFIVNYRINSFFMLFENLINRQHQKMFILGTASIFALIYLLKTPFVMIYASVRKYKYNDF